MVILYLEMLSTTLPSSTILLTAELILLYLTQFSNEPAHEIMVLITWATSEGSGEHAHPHSFARAFAVRTHEL